MSGYFLHFFKWVKFMFGKFMSRTNSTFKRRVVRNLFFDKNFKPNLLTLDIGCGEGKIATVNIDPYIEKTSHRFRTIKPKQINNFILADAQNLPFRNKIFSYTRCVHVLEHLINPFKALNEMRRVAKIRSYLCVPSILNPIDSTSTHLYTWTPYSLNNLLNKAFTKAKTITTFYELIGICDTSIPTRASDIATNDVKES